MVRGLEKSVRRRRRSKKQEPEKPSILELPIVVKDQESTMMIDCAATLVGMVRPALGEILQEVMLAVSLNARGYIIHVAIVGIGTLTACLVHPRDIFREAILRNAASIIMIHTHPSSDPEPSEEDYHLTRRILDASSTIGIPLLDHIVISEKRHWSFGEHGQLHLSGVGHG